MKDHRFRLMSKNVFFRCIDERRRSEVGPNKDGESASRMSERLQKAMVEVLVSIALLNRELHSLLIYL